VSAISSLLWLFHEVFDMLFLPLPYFAQHSATLNLPLALSVSSVIAPLVPVSCGLFFPLRFRRFPSAVAVLCSAPPFSSSPARAIHMGPCTKPSRASSATSFSSAALSVPSPSAANHSCPNSFCGFRYHSPDFLHLTSAPMTGETPQPLYGKWSNRA